MAGHHGRPRILFVARTFPPSIGGMQNLALQLSKSLRKLADVTMLVNGKGKKALPAFLPYSFISALYLAKKHRVQLIHLADALLAPIGVALKKATGLPVTATIHGLDVIFPNPIYQAVVPKSVGWLDMTMPNSRATEAVVHAHAGRATPTTAIPLGVNPLPEPDENSIRDFRERAGVGSERVLLTTGRLIKRKGVAWFVERVLPSLPGDVIYVVIGEGEEAGSITAAASAARVSERVRLLGRVPAELLAAAYASADVFVMPNVAVPGDMEGFGLVALEAAAAGLPVVASSLEGITEAVSHERNGLLVTPGSAGEFISTLCQLLDFPAEQRRVVGGSFRTYTMETFSWDRAAERYIDVMQDVLRAA